MEIRLKTLTPLWTGGVDQRCDRIHETGLIGSLRWWYEALIRGLGWYACDPNQSRCSFGEAEYRKFRATDERQRLRDAGLCDVCQTFGATGWGRKIRLRGSGGQRLFQGENAIIPSGRIHQTRKENLAGGWYLFADSRVGEFTLCAQTVRAVTQLEDTLLKAAIELAVRHGAIAGKVSSGYGVVRYADGQSPLNSAGVLQSLPTQHTARDNILPDLRDFFFGKYMFDEPRNDPDWWRQIKGLKQAANGKLDNGSCPRPLRKAEHELKRTIEQGILPIAPPIRDWLRFTWYRDLKKSRPNLPHEKEIFGIAGGESIGSKVNVSYAYPVEKGRWQFRVWGWLPCKDTLENRDDFLNELRKDLQSNALWSFIFGSTGVSPNEIEWLSLLCQEQDGLRWLKQLLPGGTP